MKRSSLNVFLLFAIFVFTGGLYNTAAQTVSGSIGGGTVSRGAAAKGSIVLSIPGGLHVNSSQPHSEYAIPTVVRLSGTGVKVSAVRYPRGKDRKFQFSENLINVYEGRVVLPFTVTVPANFKGNTVRVNATIKYQACTEEVCYPPKSKLITLTARVR